MSAPSTAREFPPVPVIVGPTGVGKTALSLEIARHLPVEIVSADSRQIYRYLDIGTAKPPPEARARIPHHFIDILNPDEEYSAGEYSKAARKVIGEILRRDKIPLVVGGSGLYIRALLRGFFREDVKDPEIRRRLEARLQQEGETALFEELRRVDPEAAERIHPHNTRRVIRALEVYYACGTPLSVLQREHPDPAPFPWIIFGLNMPRKELYARINRRVEAMFEDGLVEECRRLLAMGYSPELNALNSVGYKEVFAYLRGEMDLFTCKELVKQNTRRYAKRQLTWFRKEPDIQWHRIHSPEEIVDVARAIVAAHPWK